MNLVSTREALDRFAHELPAGTAGDRLRRLAETARALYDQALGMKGASASPTVGWADHDLAVLIAEALGAAPHGADKALVAPAETLYMGVRRRLLDALKNDPDDLAVALALALGAAAALPEGGRQGDADARLGEDIAAVAAAVERPHAGPRLAEAATRLVVSASQVREAGLEKAAKDAAPAVREAIERLSRKLPEHPDVALDRVRLVVVLARAADGHERAAALSMARGLLADHETRFGPSEAQRDVLGQVLQLRGKDAAPGDVARDALALIASDAKEGALDPRRTTKLLRAVVRAGGLDRETAKKVKELVQPVATRDVWNESLSLLFEALGDEAALVSLSEKAILDDPKDQHAARALFERLLKNLRQRLPAPFEASVLDLVIEGAPFQALGKLSADDIDALFHLLSETFGGERAVRFARRLVQAKELEGKDFVWRKALALAERAKDVEAMIDLGRRALMRKSQGGQMPHLAEVRLMLGRALVERGTDLDEADDILRPIASERGPLSGEANHLRQKLRADPRYREARMQALMAYEQQLGIGTDKKFELRVAYLSPSYALAEVAERPAPEFYEHKHLRVMLRPEDLPHGVTPNDLKKGDKILAPVRGQDAVHEKDKEKDTFRIYWVSDQRAVRFELDKSALDRRHQDEEAAFGIGSGTPVPLKVAWDAKRQRLTVRLLDKGGVEFRARPKLEAEQLPEGMTAEKVGGRGRRFMGVVARDGDGYAVVGKLVAPEPRAGATASEAAAADAADGDAATSESETPNETPTGEAATA